MLTINQVVDNLVETIIPLFIIYVKDFKLKKKKKNDFDENLAQIYYQMNLCEYEVS